MAANLLDHLTCISILFLFTVNFSGYFCYLTVGIGFGILLWLLSRLLNADSQNCSCGSVGPHTTADSDEESDGSENNSDDDIEEAASEVCFSSVYKT